MSWTYVDIKIKTIFKTELKQFKHDHSMNNSLQLFNEALYFYILYLFKKYIFKSWKLNVSPCFVLPSFPFLYLELVFHALVFHALKQNAKLLSMSCLYLFLSLKWQLKQLRQQSYFRSLYSTSGSSTSSSTGKTIKCTKLRWNNCLGISLFVIEL